MTPHHFLPGFVQLACHHLSDTTASLSPPLCQRAAAPRPPSQHGTASPVCHLSRSSPAHPPFVSFSLSPSPPSPPSLAPSHLLPPFPCLCSTGCTAGPSGLRRRDPHHPPQHPRRLPLPPPGRRPQVHDLLPLCTGVRGVSPLARGITGTQCTEILTLDMRARAQLHCSTYLPDSSQAHPQSALSARTYTHGQLPQEMHTCSPACTHPGPHTDSNTVIPLDVPAPGSFCDLSPLSSGASWASKCCAVCGLMCILAGSHTQSLSHL